MQVNEANTPTPASLRAALTAPWKKREASSVHAGEAKAQYASATVPVHRQKQARNATTASAVGHLPAGDRRVIVNLCQAMERDNPYAKAIVARTQELTIGDGPVITSASKDAKFNEEADALFNDYFFQLGEYETTPSFDVRGQWNGVQTCHAILKAWLTDGDCLIVNTPTGIQAIESHLIRTPNGLTIGSSGTNRIVDGVELDSLNRHIAYHIERWSDHETTTTRSGRGKKAAALAPIPAGKASMFLVNPNADKIGAVRGEPGLQTIWEPLMALASYSMSVAVAAEMGTYFGIIRKTNNPGALADMAEDLFDGEQPNAPQPKQIDLMPGMVEEIGSNESIEQIKPEFPTTNYGEYVRSMLMQIGAQFGLPDCALIYNGAGLSWSNIKALLALSWPRRKIEQMVLAQLVRRIRDWKMKEICEAASLAMPADWRKCEVVFPSVPVVSLGDEAKALAEMRDTNLITHKQACDMLNTGNSSAIIKANGITRKQEIANGVVPLAKPGSIPYVDTNRDGVRDADQQERPAKE